MKVDLSCRCGSSIRIEVPNGTYVITEAHLQVTDWSTAHKDCPPAQPVVHNHNHYHGAPSTVGQQWWQQPVIASTPPMPKPYYTATYGPPGNVTHVTAGPFPHTVGP